MTGEDARQILVARFYTEWPLKFPDYDIFIEGQGEPDFSKQSNPFCFFRIELPATAQIGMAGDTPPTRSAGLIEFVLFAREGQGVKPLFEMADGVTDLFVAQVVSGIRLTNVISRLRSPAIGWQSRVLRVNYNFDSID